MRGQAPSAGPDRTGRRRPGSSGLAGDPGLVAHPGAGVARVGGRSALAGESGPPGPSSRRRRIASAPNVSAASASTTITMISQVGRTDPPELEPVVAELPLPD